MKNFWLMAGWGTRLAIIYLIISLVLFALFLTGICTIILLFGSILCLATSWPWSFILPFNPLGDGDLSYILIGSVIGVIINTLIIFLIGYISEKIFKRSKLTKVAVLILIALAVFGGYQITIKSLDNPDNCEGKYNADACFYDYATERKDISLCSKIVDKGSLGRCQGSVTAQLGDPSKCATLTSNESISNCYSDLARKKQDQSLCNNIPDSKIAERCKLDNLSKTNSPTECSFFTQVWAQDRCYETLARILSDSSICSFISTKDPEQKSNCYYSRALETNDYSLCALADDNDKKYCYSSIATETKNEMICPLIEDPEYSSNCFYSVAVQTGRAELCEKVISPTRKTECQEGVRLHQLMNDDY